VVIVVAIALMPTRLDHVLDVQLLETQFLRQAGAIAAGDQFEQARRSVVRLQRLCQCLGRGAAQGRVAADGLQ